MNVSHDISATVVTEKLFGNIVLRVESSFVFRIENLSQ